MDVAIAKRRAHGLGRTARGRSVCAALAADLVRLVPARGGCLERDVHSLGLFGPDGDALLARSVELVPGRDGVGSRRYILERKGAIVASNLKIGAAEHSDVSLHPRVNVALDGDGHFLTGEALINGGGSRRLRLVPLAVV